MCSVQINRHTQWGSEINMQSEEENSIFTIVQKVSEEDQVCETDFHSPTISLLAKGSWVS